MSHFSWVISWRHYRPISSRTAEVERIFLKLKKNKKSNQIQKNGYPDWIKIGPSRKSGPVRFCHVRFGPEMPSEQSNRKNEFQRGCVSYEGVFSLAESQPDSTFRQPISSEIIESRILIGPSKNNLLQ